MQRKPQNKSQTKQMKILTMNNFKIEETKKSMLVMEKPITS
jgi:hypothetical protein